MLVMFAAMESLFGSGNFELIVRASVNRGVYIDVSLPETLNLTATEAIGREMRRIVGEDLPIVKRYADKDEAVRLLKKTRRIPAANLIHSEPAPAVLMHSIGKTSDALSGVTLPSTGKLGRFSLESAGDGIMLRTPSGGDDVPSAVWQPKFSRVLKESAKWASILRCEYLPDLNRIVKNGGAGELIRVAEALHEKKIAGIADRIAENIKKSRVVLIAGPSSSGKTSFAHRLNVQLRVNGLAPVPISLDNYFKNREDTPLTPEGKRDYESLNALDVPRFNSDLVALLEGREVTLPRYDFVTGVSSDEGCPPVSVADGQPIILEGIHALNEELTPSIPREEKFKVYVSALTELNIDTHRRIPTTDARLIRRLVRDHRSRGSGALKTLRQWPDVRRGEEKNIFPFQEDADEFFNSSLIYELAALKKYAMVLLAEIVPGTREYIRASGLMDILRCFEGIEDTDDIPNNSILREFIGDSCFFR